MMDWRLSGGVTGKIYHNLDGRTASCMIGYVLSGRLYLDRFSSLSCVGGYSGTAAHLALQLPKVSLVYFDPVLS